MDLTSRQAVERALEAAADCDLLKLVEILAEACSPRAVEEPWRNMASEFLGHVTQDGLAEAKWFEEPALEAQPSTTSVLEPPAEILRPVEVADADPQHPLVGRDESATD